MYTATQSPTDPEFVQNPYPFYDHLRAQGDLVWWSDYDMPCATSYAAVDALLRDRRFGREIPIENAPIIPPHLEPFYAVEQHSMLELEPPRHTRLRRLVLHAFTSRRIKALAPEIETISRDLVAQFPAHEFDLLPAFCQHLPVIIICRLLGVPEENADQLLKWSNDMVAMYQARRDIDIEHQAAQSASAFVAYLTDYIETRRSSPADDLISHLIAAEEDGERLSTDELITTCILLLNAGHEATVHTLGNGIRTLLNGGHTVSDQNAERICEEIMRYDPPLHMFTRYAYKDVTLFGHDFRRGDQVALLLGAANRDPAIWTDPQRFDPMRDPRANTAFGAGLHFCVGAPLARLEMQIGLRVLFETCPNLRLSGPAEYADVYHFHGLKSLPVMR